MQYKVLVDDNFHYMDESERHELGEFATAAGAVAAARRIVDEYLASAWQPGMSADELFKTYAFFGEDPFIIATGVEKVASSERDYARERCAALCRAGDAAGKN
jgi:hypothetical protein